MKIHIVQKGDTLIGIAMKYNVDYGQLVNLNPHISSPNMIFSGMKIKIPNETKQIIKEKKDTIPSHYLSLKLNHQTQPDVESINSNTTLNDSYSLIPAQYMALNSIDWLQSDNSNKDIKSSDPIKTDNIHYSVPPQYIPLNSTDQPQPFVPEEKLKVDHYIKRNNTHIRTPPKYIPINPMTHPQSNAENKKPNTTRTEIPSQFIEEDLIDDLQRTVQDENIRGKTHAGTNAYGQPSMNNMQYEQNMSQQLPSQSQNLSHCYLCLQPINVKSQYIHPLLGQNVSPLIKYRL